MKKSIIYSLAGLIVAMITVSCCDVKPKEKSVQSIIDYKTDSVENADTLYMEYDGDTF